MRHRILIVEDDEIFLRPLRRTLEVAGFEALAVSSGEDAIDLLKSDDVDLVLTDKRLPGIDGVMVVRRAIEFQELKAANRATIRRNQERFTLRNILTQSTAMHEVFEVLRSLANLDTTVLIYGETGVGKELLARSIHFSGPRRDKPFVPVNCAAIPEELFESELFGFRKGSFTGATETRRGLFQLANGGTPLLDEIGEMPLPLQSKLLRAIEDKRVSPIRSA